MTETRRSAEQLERILASATFQQVDRLKRFLSFIVTEALAGRGDQLKEYVIGVQVFGKESSFDPRADPIVRVQARRLRTRLMRYYREEGRPDELIDRTAEGRLRAGLQAARDERRRRSGRSARRSSARTPSRCCPSPITAPAGISATSARRCAQEIITALTSLETLRILAWDPTDAGDVNDPRHAADSLHAALVVSGSVRERGDDAAHHDAPDRHGERLRTCGRSRTTSRRRTFAAQEAVAQVIVKKLQAGRDRRGHRARAPPHRQPGGAEPLPAGPLPPEPAHRRRAAQGASSSSRRAIVEDSQYALAHSGLADGYGLLTHYGVFGPADVWTKAAAERGDGGDARSGFVRGAHLAGAREVDAGLGLARRRARVPAAPSASIRAMPRRTTGTRCRASCRWGG